MSTTTKFHPKNTAPSGFREITEEEFAKSRFFIYGPKAPLEYRQLREGWVR